MGFVIAILSVGTAVLITRSLRGIFQTTPNALFFCAIIFAGWRGGFWPGVLASFLSITAVKFFFTPPYHTLATSVTEAPRFIVFFIAGLFISWLSDRQRRAEAALLVARGELEEKVRRRTSALQETNQQLEGEIGERKRIELELMRLNRALRVRNACNLAVNRINDEPELLAAACRAIVEVGGYRLAWIGYAQADAGKTVRPMARAGEALDYVDQIKVTWAEEQHGQGPAGRAIRTGAPVASNEMRSDPMFVPWRAKADAFGLRSSVALPLGADGRAFGAAMVYADEPDAFGQQEADLLQQTANDLAHGIVLLRAKLERSRAEEALHRTQMELTRVARVTTVGELTASIAHEVNQPLAGVITNANASIRWLAGDAPNLDEARDAIKRIVRDGNRASDVITRIRALLKKGDPGRTRLDINQVIEEILELAQGEIARRRVEVVTELAAGLPEFMADRVQLQQLLLNLINNALDALNEVNDRPRRLVIRTDAPDPDFVRVAVSDTGSGLGGQPDNEKLFEAFYTTKENGLGMGLPISRSIVEAHGGQIRARPNAGPGVTFEFTLSTKE